MTALYNNMNILVSLHKVFSQTNLAHLFLSDGFVFELQKILCAKQKYRIHCCHTNSQKFLSL